LMTVWSGCLEVCVESVGVLIWGSSGVGSPTSGIGRI
jgi:hypothetical protein